MLTLMIFLLIYSQTCKQISCRLETIAAAERNKITLEAEAEAEAIKMRGEAQAFAIEAKAAAEAEQMVCCCLKRIHT